MLIYANINGSILHTGWVKKTIFTFIFPQLSLTSKRCELLFKKIVKTDKQAHKKQNVQYSVNHYLNLVNCKTLLDGYI